MDWKDDLELFYKGYPRLGKKVQSFIEHVRQDAIQATEERLGKGTTARVWYQKGLTEGTQAERERILKLPEMQTENVKLYGGTGFDELLDTDAMVRNALRKSLRTGIKNTSA